MIYHHFRCTLKAGVTAAERDAAIAGVREQAAQIEVVRHFVAGREIGGEFDLGATFAFEDLAAFQVYSSHPAHDRIIGIQLPLVERFVMYETTDDPDPELPAKLATLYPAGRGTAR